ncbi:MAG TPA: neuraminidase-like domain-containing protein, partial [Bryobacteraceae bacterium]
MKLQNERLTGFFERNPEFDVETFDFHNHAAVAALDFGGADRGQELALAAGYQRLLNLGGDEDTATRLMEAGFGSAHAIASISERHFVQRSASAFGGDEQAAHATYRRASSVKARARHLAAAVRDITSPYSRAMLSYNMDQDAVRYFTNIPSYQTLFGGLDHCQCEHCQSMYGPAAYFLDIMRITDEYITEANPIPDDLKLESRRPDLFTMLLDCRNTNEIIPYLQLVNEVLEAKIASDSPNGTYQTLALAPYPFNLPYSLPLNQIRVYLSYLKSTLAEIFAELLQAAAFGTAQGGGNGAPAYITLAAGSAPVTNAYTGMVVAIMAGPGAGEKRTIIAYDATSLKASVDQEWPVDGIPDATSKYTITDYRDIAREYVKLSIEQFDIVTTPAPDEASVRKFFGYPVDQAMFLPLAGGAGKLTFSAGADVVTGTDGTSFGSTVTVGDVIACAGQYRTVQSIQSATQLTVDTDWTAPASSASYMVSHWLNGAGQMRFDKGSPIAFGNEATHFDTVLTPGDQLQCVGEVRTVIAVGQPDPTTKEIPVELAGPWNVTTGFASYTINPVAALDIVATFCERTSLSRDQTVELLTQNLSVAEWTAGVAGWFFINDTGEGLPPLQILVDENDPFRSYDKIAGLSLKRLDRLNRFIRLNNVLGWTAEELNWALVTINPAPSNVTPLQTAPIDSAAIEALAGIARLKASLNLSVEILCSFWYNLKTTGRGNGVYPADLFDEIFNRPALLDGQNPYDPANPAIPFDPARPLDWTVQEGKPAPPPDAATSNATIRSRLLGALLVNDNDLTSVANYVLALLNNSSGILNLDLFNLTWLYRLTKQAAALQFKPDEYLRFLRLYYYVPVWTPCTDPTTITPPALTVLPFDPGVLPPAGGLNETIANMLLWQSAAAWLKASPFTVYELQYILTGEQSKSCQCGFTQADVATLIRDLSALSVDLRLTWGSFQTEDVDSGKSLKIFETLMAQGYINEYGIVLNVVDFSYERLAFLFPITAASFITPDISAADSAAAFELLKTETYQGKHYLVIESVTNAWVVSKEFNESWPLAFLFTTDPDPDLAAQKRIEVQSILLAAQSDINNTRKVLENARNAQEDQARAGLAHFLAAPTELLMGLLWFTEHIQTLDAYRGSLLSPLPPGALPPANVYCLASRLSRATLWVSKLEFSPADVDAAGFNPAAFGIADTTKLTFDGLRSLSIYKVLTRAFVARPGALAAYFANRANLGPEAQLAALAEITAWDAGQIEFLSDRFWPFGSTIANGGYQTVAGVERLRRCFSLGASMGVDVYFLENLYHLSDVPLADASGNLLPAAWDVYVARARNTLDALRQKSGPDTFAVQFASITGTLDTQKRNALLGYAIWTLNRDFPEIRTPSDLYQFLLIDVEMSSCATTSRIAQGIASVQLYMQRCRMNLEPYVSVAGIPTVWWEWMSNYRVWEANRKIFLYPENYIEPSLRKDATPIFRKLSEKLLQSD